MPLPYKIVWTIDDKQPAAVAKRSEAATARIEKGWLKAGTAIEKALSAAATAQIQSIGKITTAHEKASSARKQIATSEQKHIDVGYYRTAMEGIKLQDKLTASAQKAASQRQKAFDKAATSEHNRAVKAAIAKQKLDDGPLARQAEQRRRSLTQEELYQAARNRVIDVTHKKRINAIMKEMGADKDMFSQGIANALGFGSALTTVGLAATGIMTAFKGLEAVSAHYHKIAEDARAAAEATIEMRKALRVEGVLKGEPTATNKVLQESLMLRAETGLTAPEASDLTRQFLGSLPIGLEKKNITPDVAKGLMKQVAIVQARQGGDAGTRGDLAGILGQFGKVESVEKGLGQMEAIRQALTEGRGDDSPLTKQLLKVAGSIVREGGAVQSLPEMAAIIGVTSLSAGPEEAGTRAEQLFRGLKAGQTREGKRKGAVISQAGYLKGLGIKENDSLERSLDLIVPDIIKAEKEGRDPTVYLSQHGFRNEEERRALIETAENYGPLKERLKKAREEQDGTKVARENKEFLAGSLGGSGVSDALADVKKATEGLAGERFKALYGAAAASPEITAGDKALITSTVGDWMRGISTGTYWGATEAGKKERIEEKVITDITERARALGVSEEELKGARTGAYGTSDYAAEYTSRVSSLVAGKGGSLAIDTGPALAALLRAMEKANEINESQLKLMRERATAPAVPRVPEPLGAPPLAGPGR